MDAELNAVYYNPKSGFLSFAKFYKKLRKRYPRADVKRWYDAQETVQVVKTVKTKPLYQKIQASRPLEYIQMDLLDLSNWVGSNYGRRYLLTAVDVYSRFAWIRVLKKKSELADASIDLLSSIGRGIRFITTDYEFLNNRKLTKWRHTHGIVNLVEEPEDHRKLGIVNRFHRTIREKLAKVLRYQGNFQWYTVIDDLIANYNTTEHDGLRGRTPTEALAESGKPIDVWKPTLSIGDSVRVRHVLKQFEKKSGTVKWSIAVYTIVSIPTNRRVYELSNGLLKTRADLLPVDVVNNRIKEKFVKKKTVFQRQIAADHSGIPTRRRRRKPKADVIVEKKRKQVKKTDAELILEDSEVVRFFKRKSTQWLTLKFKSDNEYIDYKASQFNKDWVKAQLQWWNGLKASKRKLINKSIHQ